MGNSSIASHRKEFDAFLYAVIRQEDSGASLSVLSLLARQGVDPWDEAAEFRNSPRELAITKLVGLLGGAEGSPLQQREVRAEAIALLALLPQPPLIDSAGRAPRWSEFMERLDRLRTASEAWIRNARR